MQKIILSAAAVLGFLTFGGEQSYAGQCSCWDNVTMGQHGAKCYGYDDDFSGDLISCGKSCDMIMPSGVKGLPYIDGTSRDSCKNPQFQGKPFATPLPGPGGSAKTSGK